MNMCFSTIVQSHFITPFFFFLSFLFFTNFFAFSLNKGLHKGEMIDVEICWVLLGFDENDET